MQLIRYKCQLCKMTFEEKDVQGFRTNNNSMLMKTKNPEDAIDVHVCCNCIRAIQGYSFMIKKGSKVNAWSILVYEGKPHIILEFNHSLDTAYLAEWKHEISPHEIRKNMPMKLKPKDKIKVPIDSLEGLWVLYKW